MNLHTITLDKLAEAVSGFRISDPSVSLMSPLRVSSFLHNPKALSTDTVLIVATLENEIIGYRILLPDSFYSQPPIRFAWVSGIWVKPEHRRTGLGKKMMSLALDAWDNRLMGTAFAPESKALYLGLGDFVVHQTLEGYRYYRRFALAKLLKQRVHTLSLPALKLIDKIGNLTTEVFARNKSNESREYVQELLNFDEIGASLQSCTFSKNYRTLVDYAWISKYPWLKNKNEAEGDEPFYFSYLVDDYENNWYKLSTPSSFCILHVIVYNGQMKILHEFNEGFSYAFVAEFILNLMAEKNLKYLTCFNNAITEQMNMSKNEFIFRKKQTRTFLITKELQQAIKNINYSFGEGAGDAALT